MKHVFVPLAVSVAVAGGLLACGSDGDSSQSEREAALAVKSSGNGCGPAGNTTLVPRSSIRIFGKTVISTRGYTIKTASLVPEGPSGVFHTPCQNHDDCYGRWGSSKPQCDTTFKTEMLARCSSASCRAAAQAYYQAVASKGGDAFLKAQVNTGRSRPISINIAAKPPSVTTSPFATFIVYPTNGSGDPITCVLDGIPRPCPPAPQFVIEKKGKHTIVFKTRNNRGSVQKSYSWTVK